MKNIIKISLNMCLLVILVAILIFPIGFMGLMSFEENTQVLSAEDSKIVEIEAGSLEDSLSETPEDIRELIIKLEREYYQKIGQENSIEDEEETEIIEDVNVESDVENILD